MSDPLTLWLIGDGKPGHENQSLGLAEAVSRMHPCEVHRISLAGGIVGRMRRAMSEAASLPRPDAILAAGHATHLALLVLGWRFRAPTIVLMKPSLPLAGFGLCLAPEHDFPNDPGHQNLLLTRGAINRIDAGAAGAAGKLVLLGGPSKTHGWDADGMLEMLSKVCVGDGWQLTDSRRTPAGFCERLAEALPQVEIHSHRETGPDWLPAQLREAGEVWVSEDSTSMVYEALTSGARVGLLPVPRERRESRVLNGVQKLIEDGYLTPYDGWLESRELVAPPLPLREADRCAELVLRWIEG